MADPPETAPTDPPAGSGRTATALYLVGLVGFVVSGLAYPAVLILGGDLLLVVAVNAAAVGLLVAWAAHDTLVDSGSAVTTVPGAVGTAMVLLAVYGLLATVVVAVTSPWHDHLAIAWLLAVEALAAGVLAVVTFPLEAFVGESPADDADPAAEETRTE